MPETAAGTSPKTHEFVFFLADMFSMMPFAAALEPLRQANRMSRQTLYSWRLVSENGQPVTASNGITIEVDSALDDIPREASIAICTGFGLEQAASRAVMTWLRKQARRGVGVGALCTGSYVLAKAGLLDGKRCTIHWENHASFMEEFPEVELSNLLYCLDDGIFSCAGGTSAADMMLHIITDEHGHDLGSLVADTMVHTPLRSDTDEQRLSVPARIGVRHPKLVSIIQTMERSTEEPVSPSELAKSVNMSTRQLERLFRRYLNRSPKRYYMELRLEKARNLLLQTDMSVINVALACGFTSPSHFSKCYRAHFNRTPYRERGSPTNTGYERTAIPGRPRRASDKAASKAAGGA